MTSRRFRAWLALLLWSVVSGQAYASGPLVVKVGVLFSKTGTMSTSETPLIEAAKCAISQVNSRGVIRLDPIYRDGASDPAVFAREAAALMDRDGVRIVFGCWTSDARKAVLKVMEPRHGLLFYPVQYEGLESSPAAVYTGLTANQQLFPCLDWLVKNRGPRIYLVGSDYLYPRTANRLARQYLKAIRGTVVGEVYRPRGSKDFDGIARAIARARPDAIVSTINGDSQVAFFEAYRKAGLSSHDCPIMSLSMAEAEVAQVRPIPEGQLAVWGYFSTLDNPANRRLLQSLSQCAPTAVVDDPVATSYWQIQAFALAAERARSTEPEAIRKALRGLILDTAMGLVRIDPRNFHTWRTVRIGRVNSSGQFTVVWSSRATCPARAVSPISMSSSSVSRVTRLAGRLRRSFRVNVLSLVLLASILPAIFVSFFHFVQLREQIRSAHRNLLSTLAIETSRQVKQWLDEQEAVARAFARTGDLNQQWLSLSNHSPDSDEFFLDLARLHRIIAECNQSSAWITEVRLSDTHGKVLLSDNSESLQGAFIAAEGGVDLDDVIQKGQTRHSNVYLAVTPAPMGIDAPQLATGFPTMMISAPIRGEGDAARGILSCRLAIADIGPVKFPTEAYSQPLDIYLATTEGVVVSTNRRGDSKGEELRIPPTGLGMAWPRPGENIDGFRSHTGRDVVGAWANVPTTNLVVLVEVPLRVLQDPQRNALVSTIALCLVLCGLSALAALWRANHLLAPLRDLQNATIRLALGDLTVRTKLEGEDEFAQLSQTFDHMAATLETNLNEMQQAQQEAMAANRAKSRFLANMTHELRTPLNAVIGYSEMIMAEAKDGPVASEQLVEDLEVIRSSGQSLLSLVNEILDLTKIEAGKMDFHPEEMNLEALLDGLASTIKPLVENQGNRLIREPGEVVGTVFLDRSKLKQILMNLLSNACKFTRNGEIRLRAGNEGDSIRLEVADTGIGMTEAQQDKIFVEFDQVEDTSSRRFGGTGLGLAIVKRVATMMEGSITVSSKVGVGSTFTLVLPRRLNPSPHPSTLANEGTEDG